MVGRIPETLWALPRRLRDATADPKAECIVLSGNNQAKRCGLTRGSSQIAVADADMSGPIPPFGRRENNGSDDCPQLAKCLGASPGLGANPAPLPQQS